MNTTTCPRCGKAVIEVKDMGLSGRLLIHSHGFETVKMGKKTVQIPVQDACRITTTELATGLKWTVPQ